ncbi:MAG: hypothetical protein LBU12_06185 [Deltaproteobacteria bacterium]|jgi:hypothetical protein|nr:hypothetical protein [Deltaproteobacteria bacterium]
MILAKKLWPLWTLVLLVALSGLALAQTAELPPDDGPGLEEGPPPDLETPQTPPGLSGERLALWNKLREEHLEKAWPLFEDLRDQRLVYRAMVGSSAIRADEIWKVVADMRGTRDQLRGLQKAYAGRLAKNGFDDVAFEPVYGVAEPRLDPRDYDDRHDRSYEPGNDATDDGSAYRHRGFRNPRRHWPNRHW